MYTFNLVAVGRIKGASAYLDAGIAEYLKRLKPHMHVTITDVAEELETPSVTREQVMTREAERILACLKPGARMIALSERGERVDSQTLSQRLFGVSWTGVNPPNGGMLSMASEPIIVVVGGPLGLSPKVLERADWVVSLSPMTFPHQMVRLIFLEQLYRALKIFRNEPYHK